MSKSLKGLMIDTVEKSNTLFMTWSQFPKIQQQTRDWTSPAAGI